MGGLGSYAVTMRQNPVLVMDRELESLCSALKDRFHLGDGSTHL